MRAFATFAIIILLLVPLGNSATYASKSVWIGALKYEFSAVVDDPYSDHINVSIKLVDVNRTMLGQWLSFGVGFIKYIFVTFDYYSKVFDMNMTYLFRYGNNTYEAHNYSFSLYFPIPKSGNWRLNVTVVVWSIMFVLSMDVPVSLILTANVPESKVSSTSESVSWIYYWLYGLTIIAVGELGVIVYLFRKVRE